MGKLVSAVSNNERKLNYKKISTKYSGAKRKIELTACCLALGATELAIAFETHPVGICASKDDMCLSRTGAILVIIALVGAVIGYRSQSDERMASDWLRDFGPVEKAREGSTAIKRRVQLKNASRANGRYHSMKDTAEESKLVSDQMKVMEFALAAYGTFLWGFGDTLLGWWVGALSILPLLWCTIWLCWVCEEENEVGS